MNIFWEIHRIINYFIDLGNLFNAEILSTINLFHWKASISREAKIILKVSVQSIETIKYQVRR
jgi:hypothetical protein